MLLNLIDHWRSPPPDPHRVAWLRGRVFAHRGLHGSGAVENSPTAFDKAIARGLGIECDVRQAGDGGVVVFHDRELARLTGRPGLVVDHDARALCEMTLTGSADRIPALRNLLGQVGGQVPLLVEIKTERAMHVAPFCQRIFDEIAGYLGEIAVMSFDPRAIGWFARNAPQIVRGLVVTEGDSGAFPGSIWRHRFLWRARPDFLAYDIRDLPSSFARSQRERGLPVLTWTVRTVELLKRALEHADAPIAEAAGIT